MEKKCGKPVVLQYATTKKRPDLPRYLCTFALLWQEYG
jgi:hypothetical protein